MQIKKAASSATRILLLFFAIQKEHVLLKTFILFMKLINKGRKSPEIKQIIRGIL